MKHEGQRGGARPGAGRKRGKNVARTTIWLAPGLFHAIRGDAARKGQTASVWIGDAAKDALIREYGLEAAAAWNVKRYYLEYESGAAEGAVCLGGDSDSIAELKGRVPAIARLAASGNPRNFVIYDRFKQDADGKDAAVFRLAKFEKK